MQSSPEKEAAAKPQSSRWRSAYATTIQLTNTVLAPSIIIKLLVDLQDSLDFLKEHILPSLVIFLILVAVFATNLIDFKDLKRGLSDTAANLRWRYLRVIAYVLSAAALVALLSVGLIWLTSGFYFVIIASAPNQAAAEREVEQINTLLEEQNASGLRARANPSGDDNPWYSIVVGRPFLSRQAAEEALQKARRTIPQFVDKNAYVKAYDFGVWLDGDATK